MVSACSDKVQEVPLHAPPDHPAKVEPVAGVAARVTEVPPLNMALQAEPQLIPEGLLVTVPPPAPLSRAVSWKCGVPPPVMEEHPQRRLKHIKRQRLPTSFKQTIHTPMGPQTVKLDAGIGAGGGLAVLDSDLCSRRKAARRWLQL